MKQPQDAERQFEQARSQVLDLAAHATNEEIRVALDALECVENEMGKHAAVKPREVDGEGKA